jgi:hypothetical protein
MSGALHVDHDLVAQVLTFVPLGFAGLGTALVAGLRLRATFRRRRQLARLAEALRLPVPQIARAADGRLGFTLPAAATRDAIENEGGYRGVQPADVLRVDASVRTWTALSAPVQRVPGVVRVRPSSSRDLYDSLAGFVQPIGDVAFDDAFVIHASSAGTAARVLGYELRRLLLRLPRSEESPRLTLDAGTIRLEWHGEPDPALIQTAASALRRVASFHG